MYGRRSHIGSFMEFDMAALFGPDRATAFATVAALAAVNGFAAIVGGNIFAYGVWASLIGLGGVSAIAWFAIFSLILIAQRHGEPVTSTKTDRAVMLGMIVAL